MSKKLQGPAFGSQSVRFNLNGVHPNLLATGRMPYEEKLIAQTKNLGPGSYDTLRYSEFSDLNVVRRADGPNWERGVLTEKMAKMPHLLYQEAFKKKMEDKRRVGPGYYNIKDSFDAENSKPHSKRGMLDALSDRFSYEYINNNPGPGDYGIPDEKIEEKRKNKPGKVPLFERSKEPRSLPIVGSEVPPATYNHKNSIDELIKKRVSNRGPYDLFSEIRSAPIKTGHYVEDQDKKLGPGQYDIPSFVDALKNTAHAKHGKFGKIAQYPVVSGDRLSVNNTSLQPRNPKWPGPGYYDPGELSKVEGNNPPFLTSSVRGDKRSLKKFNNNYNPVGVGRYDIQKIDETENKNGHKSIFLSKSPQITDQNIEKYKQERLKPHNLDRQEKMNLHLTGNVHGQALTA